MLQSQPLQEFGLRILHDPGISIPLVRIPASRDHHHARPGGLLEHAMEAALHVPWLREGMESIEWEVAAVAALFHDIGKTRNVPGRKDPSDEARLTRHEDATFEVLAPHLEWLRQRESTLVAMLRHHLGLRASEARPLMPGAMLVSLFDRLSAACDARGKAFSGRPIFGRFGKLDVAGPPSYFYRPGAAHRPVAKRSA